MTRRPWFPFYVDDFWQDEAVACMSLEEVGLYVRLLSLQWREGSIPSDLDRLARICGIDGPAMARLWLGLWPCFSQVENQADRLINRRLAEIANRQTEVHRKLSEQGQAGARKRWGEHGPAIAPLKPGYSIVESESEGPTTTNPLPPLGANQTDGVEDDPASPSGEPDPPQEAKNQPSRRKKAKKPLTPAPETFEPSKGSTEWFRRKFGTVPKTAVDLQTEKFLENHRSKGNVFVNWQSAWKTWMVNWQTDFGKRVPPGAGSQTKPDGVPDDDPNLVRPDDGKTELGKNRAAS